MLHKQVINFTECYQKMLFITRLESMTLQNIALQYKRFLFLLQSKPSQKGIRGWDEAKRIHGRGRNSGHREHDRSLGSRSSSRV